MQEKIKVVIVGNIAFDVNTFPDRDNGKHLDQRYMKNINNTKRFSRRIL